MVRAELLKLRTVTGTWVALAIGVLGLLLTQVLTITVLPAIASGVIPGADIGDELGNLDPGSLGFQVAALNVLGGGGNSLGSVSITAIVVLILGLLVATTDYRFGGIVSTALAEPRRWRILGGKTAATAVTAALLGVVLSVICLGTLLVSTAVLPGVDLVVPAPDIAFTLMRGIAVVVLFALLGLAIGTLVRSQLAGVLVVIALLFVEPILQGLAQLLTGAVPLWAQLLPLSLGLSAIAGADAGLAIPPAVALLALAGIVALLLGLAGTVLRRRDL